MTIALSTIVEAICTRAGITSVDVSELEDVEIEGYALTREMTAAAALEPLRMAGFFDIVGSDGVLCFRRRGGAPVATITEDELGAHADTEQPSPAVTTTKTQDLELPRQLRLQYSSAGRDYERGEQLSPSRLDTTVGVNEVTIQCPLILDDNQAAQIAEVLWRDAWASRNSHEFTLDHRRHALEPADPLLVPVDGRLQRMRVTTFNDSGLLLRRARAVRDDNGAYVSTAVAQRPLRPLPIIELLGETDAVLLDLPALSEDHNDAGFYVAARRTGTGLTWRGARLHRSLDGGTSYAPIAVMAAQAPIGEVVEASLTGDPNTWDDSTEFVVDLFSGQLESRTDAAVLTGANAAAVGAHGRWHIIQFANAELISSGRYRLTRLLHGRRGTEQLIGSVVPGDRFVLLSAGGVYRVPLATSEIGAERLYRAVTSGAAFDSAEDQAFTGAGQALKPFAPCHLTQTTEEDDDLAIDWFRRDRLGQTLRSGVQTRMSEDVEEYEVDILTDGLTVVRTLEVTDSAAVYAAADQVSDFGSLQSTVSCRVYQMSAAVGRGAPLESIGSSGGPVAGVLQYSERLSRPIIDGDYVYVHRATNAVGSGNTGIYQLLRADLSLVSGISPADVLAGFHVYDGELWALGYDSVNTEGRLWRTPTDSEGFGATTAVTAVDVDEMVPGTVTAFGNFIFGVRHRPFPSEFHLIVIDLDTPEITIEVETDGNEVFAAASSTHLFVLRDDGRIDKYDHSLTPVTDTTGYSDARGLIYDPALEQLYLLSATRLVALDADLNELWVATFADSDFSPDGSFPANLTGLNVAVDATRGEVIVAGVEFPFPEDVSFELAQYFARFDDTTGAFNGRYRIPGAVQAVLCVGSTLWGNTVRASAIPSVFVHRFNIFSGAYLLTVEDT